MPANAPVRSAPSRVALLATALALALVSNAGAAGRTEGGVNWSRFAERQQREIADAKDTALAFGCETARRSPACAMLASSIERMEANLWRIRQLGGATLAVEARPQAVAYRGDGPGALPAAAGVAAPANGRVEASTRQPQLPDRTNSKRPATTQTPDPSPSLKRPVRVVGPAFFPDL